MPNYSKHSEYVFDIADLVKLFAENPNHSKVYISIGFELDSSKIYKARVLAETGNKPSDVESRVEGGSSAGGCPNPPGC